MRKIRYPQQCYQHPERTEGLKYVYYGGRVGWLMCLECQNEVEGDEGKVSNLRKSAA